jgi:hypothetical protein
MNPYQISFFESHWLSVLIGLCTLLLILLLNMTSNLLMQFLIPLAHSSASPLNSMVVGLASRPIIGKFSLSKEEIPLTDVLCHKTPQEVSQTSINNFSLTIFLGMVFRVELEHSSKLSPKCTPKMTNKLGIKIGSDRFGNAMKLDYLPEIQFSSMRCIKSFVARDKMGHL